MSQVAPQFPAQPSSTDQPIILRGVGLRKTFRMGEEDLAVLKNVDLTLRRGEFVAIEGRSGSGKSTLLHILGGLDTPDAGSVSFSGKPYAYPRKTPTLGWVMQIPQVVRLLGLAAFIAAMLALVLLTWRLPIGSTFLIEITSAAILLCLSFRWEKKLLLLAGIWAFAIPAVLGWQLNSYAIVPLVTVAMVAVPLLVLTMGRLAGEVPICNLRNSEFGFVFQFYHLLPELNVLENTLNAPLVSNSWLTYAMHRRRLTNRAIELLNELGLGHRLRHKPNQLSGGERQRVAIARALMNEPKILFADEPTGNLDYETGRQIMSVLERLHREKSQTIVMVTHDRSLANRADRILVLRGGRLERAEDAGADKPAAPDYD